jgi:hypothetical protein
MCNVDSSDLTLEPAESGRMHVDVLAKHERETGNTI